MVLHTFSFFIGFLVGFGVQAIIVYMWFRSVMRRNRASLPPTPKEKENDRQAKNFAKDNSESEMRELLKKMRQVETLTKMQQDIMGQINTPSANAVHSKHKNTLGARVKELEQQKYDILASVVDSGYDPVIVAVDPSTGEPTESKLSDYLASIKGSSDVIKDDPVARRRSKLRLVTAEENFDRDDDDSNDKIIH